MFSTLAAMLPYAPGDPTAPPAAVTAPQGPSWFNTAGTMGLVSLAIILVSVIVGLGIMLMWKKGNLKDTGNSAGVFFIGLSIIGVGVTAGVGLIAFGDNLFRTFFNV